MRGLFVSALALLGAALLSVGCEGVRDREPEVPPSPTISWKGTIVAFGDSLTAGDRLDENEAYPARLQELLTAGGEPWRVVNAGVSGETSSGALSRVEWILESLSPDIVILETGANDGLRGIDVDLARENILSIVTRLQEEGVTVVLAGMQMVKNLGEDYGLAFAALYGEVAAETGGHPRSLLPRGGGRRPLSQPRRRHSPHRCRLPDRRRKRLPLCPRGCREVAEELMAPRRV